MSDPFRSLLPPNASAAERAIEQAASRAAELPVPLRDLWNPWTCPARLLPWLAWTLSVDEWDPQWDEATKRQVIAESFTIHLKKGTRGSVERILQLVGFPAAALTEWFEPAPNAAVARFHTGEPHTFSIGIDPIGNPALFDEALYQRLFRLLAHTVPARSHLCLYLDVHVPTGTGMGLTTVATQHKSLAVDLSHPPFRTTKTLGIGCTAAAVQRVRATACIEPKPLRLPGRLGVAPLAAPTAVVNLTLEI